MLYLSAPSPPEWIEKALADLPEVLLDHAHLEKKAASTAIGLLFRYPDKTAMLAPLSALAREELAHFELMLGVLEEHGIPFEKQKPSSYAGRLFKGAFADEPRKLLDTLLICGLIEARSCERMRILAENLEDKKLAKVYEGLLISEARHHKTYLDFAKEYFPEDQVRPRAVALAKLEAEIIQDPDELVRMHS